MISKRRSTSPGKVLVTFSIPGTIWAERINLVGDFNNWDKEGLPFLRDRRGNWVIKNVKILRRKASRFTASLGQTAKFVKQFFKRMNHAKTYYTRLKEVIFYGIWCT